MVEESKVESAKKVQDPAHFDIVDVGFAHVRIKISTVFSGVVVLVQTVKSYLSTALIRVAVHKRFHESDARLIGHKLQYLVLHAQLSRLKEAVEEQVSREEDEIVSVIGPPPSLHTQT